MAKPLGPKSLLIREAITAHPDTGNTDLAQLIAGSDARKQDRIKASPNDVAQQRQAMKKAGALPARTNAKPVRARKKRRGGPSGSASNDRKAPSVAAVSPVDLIDRVFVLAEDCGGLGQLKRLVERLAGVPGR